MKAREIAAQIDLKIRSTLGAHFGNRVYQLTSKQAVPSSYFDPFCFIIYKGARVPSFEKTGTSRLRHRFEIYAYTSIWVEGKVAPGVTGKAGLLEILADLYAALKDETFEIALAGAVYTADVVEVFGIDELQEMGTETNGFVGSVGLAIEYGEGNA